MPSRTTSVIGVLALALLIRAAVAIGLQYQLDHRWQRQFLIEGDAAGYWTLAEKLTNGEAFEIYSPPRQALRMPGFPAFLALNMSLMGGRMLGIRLSLCLVGTLAVGLVYWLGVELIGHTTGLIASLLAAVSPVMAGFTPLILSETLFAACLMASLVAMSRLVRHVERHDWRPWVAAITTGGTIALACYVRPSWLLAGPLFGIALVVLSANRFRAAGLVGVVLLTLFAALLPWGLRNQRVTGHFVLTTLWVGPSLYDGLNPQAGGDSDMTFFDRENLAASMTEYEVDREYRQRAWTFVKENPARTLQLAAIKFARFWSPFPNASQFDHWLPKLAVAGFFLPVLLFGLIGGIHAARGQAAVDNDSNSATTLRPRLRVAWFLLLTAGPILYFTALHLVFVSSLRYRLPAEYPLLVLTAAGLQVCRHWSRRRKQTPQVAA
ncbi:MAG: hypothetical protein DWQ34_17980 [Planctomycetota bacterium]|nr:MAG: hypothetical protein DWQ29_22355 [Planctomycetota bacterium]REJ90171.1 MAG: hypothetical protein DWQ34_17980 [Planctomycetota bacterium]REK20109.1 MAG: hypothetical protein DWQ41_26305 [Planctomycetota bacterium]REK34299.1 MAG: hypothetical protein DWQ45_13540 [Planctomycetota bacterium]